MNNLPSPTDPIGSTTNFAYELRGLLTSITDPLQKITSLTYDVNGSATRCRIVECTRALA